MLAVGLSFAQPAQAAPRRFTETFSSGNLALATPPLGKTSSSIFVPGGGAILDVRVSVRLTHPDVRGLKLTLETPNGAIAGEPLGGDGFATEADLGAGAPDCSGTPAHFANDGADFTFSLPPFVGTYAPDAGFGDLRVEDAYGRWRLALADRSGSASTLHCWTLTVTRRVEVAQASGRRAELSYFASEDEYGFPLYSDMRLRIVRDGKDTFNRPLQKACRFCEIWPQGATSGSSIRFRQLDVDPAPELVFDYFSGGASCCSLSRIYDERGTSARMTERNWTRVGYRLIRPPRSRAPIFQSGDGRFTCALAACAFSPAPIQLLSFRSGKLVDVTRSYRAPVRRDMARQWRSIQQLKADNYEITGALAAWLADKHLLGQGRQGWRVVRGFVKRGEVARYGGYVGRITYLEALRRLLARSGYLR